MAAYSAHTDPSLARKQHVAAVLGIYINTLLGDSTAEIAAKGSIYTEEGTGVKDRRNKKAVR